MAINLCFFISLVNYALLSITIIAKPSTESETEESDLAGHSKDPAVCNLVYRICVSAACDLQLLTSLEHLLLIGQKYFQVNIIVRLLAN